jgi:hypothetical protein
MKSQGQKPGSVNNKKYKDEFKDLYSEKAKNQFGDQFEAKPSWDHYLGKTDEMPDPRKKAPYKMAREKLINWQMDKQIILHSRNYGNFYKEIARGWEYKLLRSPLDGYDNFSWTDYLGANDNRLGSLVKERAIKRDSDKIAYHDDGGMSRSYHEVVIRDILFFSNIDFIYEPWYNLEETQEKAPTVQDKTYEEIFESIKGAAKNYNLARDENGKPIPVLDENGEPVVDPETKKIIYKRKEIDGEEHTAYENRKPSPDFLINGSLYFEVFGWGGEVYELKKEFKKDQFSKLLEDFKYIEKDALDLAAPSRSLKAYAEVLDTKVCIPCGEKECPCNSDLGLRVLIKLIKVAPLFEASGRNISLIDSYIDHMSQYVEYVDDKQHTALLELVQ